MILTLKLRLYTCRRSQLQETVGVWVCKSIHLPCHYLHILYLFLGTSKESYSTLALGWTVNSWGFIGTAAMESYASSETIS